MKKTSKLTGRNARADVHGGDLDFLAGTQIPPLEPGLDGGLSRSTGGGGSSALGVSSSWAGGGLLVVVDDDTDASTTLTSSELHLGALGQGSLGVLQGAVETGLTLGKVRCLSFLAGSNLLAHTLERGDLLGLYELALWLATVFVTDSPTWFSG